jgi:hypothetical protein
MEASSSIMRGSEDTRSAMYGFIKKKAEELAKQEQKRKKIIQFNI